MKNDYSNNNDVGYVGYTSFSRCDTQKNKKIIPGTTLIHALKNIEKNTYALLKPEKPTQPTLFLNNNKTQEEKGLDFILSHLSSPLFPRKISTKHSNDSQFMIDNKEEVLTAYRDSQFIDCRINAFPLLREGKSWIPDLLFIDLDLQDCNTRKGLDIALAKILRNISRYLGIHAIPTVLMSGNGIHVIQPVNCVVTDYLLNQKFQEFADNRLVVNGIPAEEFLRFAKILLSDNKADKNNNPSFRSCLLRVPGTINSKNGERVKILQEWNGYRPTITKELFIMFHEYLIQKKIDYNLKQEKIWKERRQLKEKLTIKRNINNYGNYYKWIDKLLQTGIEDCRKVVIDLILSSYLIYVKRLEYAESYKIIRQWLEKCNSVQKLDDNEHFNNRINRALKSAESKQIGPMSAAKIKTDNTYDKLYTLLKDKGILV